MNDRPLRFHTVTEVADMLSVTTTTVRRYIDEGRGGVKLRAHRIGGTAFIRIEEADLRAFMGMDTPLPEPIQPRSINEMVRLLEKSGIIRPGRARATV